MPEPRPDPADDTLRHFMKADARLVAERLLGHHNPALSSQDEWRWGSKGSISVALRGPKAGTWYDFEAGQGGDMFALVQSVTGGNFADAVAWARTFTGAEPERRGAVHAVPPPPSAPKPPDPADEARRANRVEYARRLAGESVPADGTPADHYLRQVRGVPRPDGGWPDAVRWHPGHRALLVVATDAAGAVQSVQRVHLTSEGAKIGEAERAERNLRAVKVSNGVFSGAGVAVRLPGSATGPLLVAEGPETGLAAWASTGHETWIALGSVGKVQPPAGRRVVLVSDDNPGREDRRLGAAERGVEKTLAEWQGRGLDAVRALPWPERRHDRSDFADVILRHGPDAVRERIAPAVEAPARAVSDALNLKGRDMSDASDARIPAPLAADDPRIPSMGFARQNIETDYRLAHSLGVVARVEALAAEGLTARQTVERLGPALDRVDELARLNGEPHFADKNKVDLVRAVRNKLDIPASDDRAEFAAWLASRGQVAGQASPPSPGEPRAGAATAAPARGDIPPVNGPDEGRAVARILAEAKLPDADPERIRATLAPFDDAARARIQGRATWALDRRAEATGDRASAEVLALALASPPVPAQPKLDPASAPPPPASDAGDGRRPFGDTPLSVDAQTIYQAVSKLLETHHVIAAEDLKPRVSAMLAAREAEGDRIVLAPEVRLAAGKPPVHTLDEMREMFAAVRERAAVPSDRMTPETAAEVRESLQQQFKGARSMVDLMKLYAEGDVQRAMKSLDAHPEHAKALADAMEATGKRLLAEDRVKLGLDEPAERRRTRGVQDAPSDGPGAALDAPAVTIARRGDNGAPSTPERVPERTADPLARDYDIRDKGDERHYHRRDDGKLAIRATETHLHGVQRDATTIGAMLDLAVSRGWNDVQIKGDREAARVAWIEASARGLKAEGYTPTRDDRHAAEQRRVERREQGLDVPAAPERAVAVERQRAAEVPERTPGRAGREDRASWVKGTGGYEALGPAQREHAERAHTNWRAANPDRAELQDIRDYVGFVQGKEAERRHAREDQRRGRERDRDDERHTPPLKVQLPSRGLNL